jgi:hypothetical protein
MSTLHTKDWVALAAITAAVLILCYRSPYSASELEIVPDSVEYCAGAYNIVAHGRYEMQIQDQWYPPRYSPWFSLFFLMPAYVMAPLHLGAPIIVILLMSILSAVMAYQIGHRISGTGGGCLAAVLLMSVPSFRTMSMSIMTDVPCTALCLTTASLYLGLTRASRTGKWLIAGLTCALAFSLRPLTAPLCLPFLIFLIRHRPQLPIRKAAALLTPSALMLAATMLYNHVAFGSLIRNGYNFWCAVPYDYLTLTFGFRFASSNIATLLIAMKYLLPVALLLIMLTARYRRGIPRRDAVYSSVSRLMSFTAIALSLLTVAHLLYFYPEQRFFLPLVSCIAVMVGGLAGSFLPLKSTIRLAALLSALLLACIFARVNTERPTPTRRIMAE